MNLRAPCLFACLWLPLAAWLALGPAAQSRQAAFRGLQPVRTVLAQARSCRSGCAARPQSPAAPERHGCCGERQDAPCRVPTCPEGNSSRCLQCYGQGGPVLFAQAPPVPEPERCVLGAFTSGDLVAASRDLRPPEPPPRPGGAIPAI